MSNHPNETVRTVGKHMLEANKIVQEYRQQSQFMQDQEPSAVTGPTGTNLAPITPETAFTAPVSRGTPNALAPAAAPQVNALAAPQGKTAESLATKINEGDRKYGTAPGWLKQRELLGKEFDLQKLPDTFYSLSLVTIWPDSKKRAQRNVQNMPNRMLKEKDKEPLIV